MPFIGIPWAVASAIAAIAGAGTSVGLGIDSALNQPGKPPAPTTTPTPLTTTQNAGQTASVANALPTLQSLTGGSVSPEYTAQFGATQAGLQNDPQSTGNVQAAVNQFFGLTAPGSSGLTPSATGGGTDILSLLSKAAPQTPQAPSPSGGGGNDIVSQLLSGQDFKGLQLGA
jgi:hypothetical protein